MVELTIYITYSSLPPGLIYSPSYLFKSDIIQPQLILLIVIPELLTFQTLGDFFISLFDLS